MIPLLHNRFLEGNMPVICTAFMHKRRFRNSEKEDGNCLDINLLRVYSSPLEIHTCYSRVWQRRGKQGMPPNHRTLSLPAEHCVCPGFHTQRGWSRPASPGAVLELSSSEKAPGGAANWAIPTCLWYGQDAGFGFEIYLEGNRHAAVNQSLSWCEIKVDGQAAQKHALPGLRGCGLCKQQGLMGRLGQTGVSCVPWG